MLGSRNKQLVADSLKDLSFRLGFRSIDGFAERVVYREFFPRGLTALDDLDETTLRLQYLETLKLVGTSKATKIVLPMEVGGVLRGVSELLGGLPSGGPDARPDPAAVEPPTST